MKNENNETIEDIVRELRSEPLAECGAKPWLHYLADRIESAAKRERESGAEAAQICGEIGDETIEVMEAGKAITAAISAPPRNCDVGTADEQSDRFDKFCYSHSKCYQCPVQSIWNSTHRQKRLREIIRCEIIWSQMPYEEASEMKDYSNVRAVCFDCARKAGFVQKNKAVIAFEDECGICKARRPCTDLRNDWMPPKKENDVK